MKEGMMNEIRLCNCMNLRNEFIFRLGVGMTTCGNDV